MPLHDRMEVFFVATCWFPYFSTITHHIEDAGKNLRFSLEIIWVFVIVSQVRFQLLSSLQADDDTYCSWLRYAPLQQYTVTHLKVNCLQKVFTAWPRPDRGERFPRPKNSLKIGEILLLFIEIREKNEIRNQGEMVSFFKFEEIIDFSADPTSQWWNKRHKLLEIQGPSMVAGATGTEIYPWENSKCSWLFCWQFYARCVKAFL